MVIMKCKMCGGDMELSPDKTLGVCEYCGSTTTFPKVDDEQRAAAFNRGNHFRRMGEFDKALAVYERIVQEDESDAEAHWCCALCRFGIEYVKDPDSGEYVPTCHRASFDSFLQDVDFQAAVAHAEGEAKSRYQEEAEEIAAVQRGILSTVQKEEPFDVFICYKETAENGQRTVDSTLAQDIYYELTEQGRRVFFSRITLEDKAGQEYEPYIFAALRSARVMLVVGTRPEYLNSAWVKNEWSRYLALMKQDRKRLLIPCYRDMDPYDLPEQLSVLQSYDMSKIGFIQDLIRGVSKVLDADEQQEEKNAQSEEGDKISVQLKRGQISLEDQEWKKANYFFEQALNMNAECAQAYWGQVLAKAQCSTAREYIEKKTPGMQNLEGTIQMVPPEPERINQAVEEYWVPEFVERHTVRNLFENINRRYVVTAEECQRRFEEKKSELEKDKLLNRALRYGDQKLVSELEQVKQEIFRICEELVEQAQKQDEENARCAAAQYAEGIAKAEQEAEQMYERGMKKREEVAEGRKTFFIAGLVLVGILIAFPLFLKFVVEKMQEAPEAFVSGNLEEEIEPVYGTIAAGSRHSVGLKADGTVVAVGSESSNQCSVSDWREIVLVSAGGLHTVGLKADGTVVAVGNKSSNQCSVSDWREIVLVSAGGLHTVGLKADGTVVACGWNDFDQCNVSEWKDIVSVSAGYSYTVGLKEDGTVIAVGKNSKRQCDLSEWKDIVSISAGSYHTVGLKADGTVVAAGWNENGQCGVSDWRDIVSITAGFDHTVGLKSDGTVIAAGSNKDGQCEVSEWEDIVAVSANETYTLGLKADGTVVATGRNDYGQCDVSDWCDIRLRY